MVVVSVRHKADTQLRRAVEGAIREGRVRSQSYLARRLHISESQMSRYMNGLYPAPRDRVKLTRALGVEESDLWSVRQDSDVQSD